MVGRPGPPNMLLTVDVDKRSDEGETAASWSLFGATYSPSGLEISGARWLSSPDGYPTWTNY